MRRTDAAKVLPDAQVRSSSQTDNTTRLAMDLLNCGIATLELLSAGFGPAAAPIVLDGAFRGVACVANMTANLLGNEQTIQATHDATSLMSIPGLVGGTLGLVAGGSSQSMTLGATAGNLLGGTLGQALSPKSGLLGNLEFTEYVFQVADATAGVANETPVDSGFDSYGPLDTTESSKDFEFTGGDPSDVTDSLPADLQGPVEVVV